MTNQFVCTFSEDTDTSIEWPRLTLEVTSFSCKLLNNPCLVIDLFERLEIIRDVLNNAIFEGKPTRRGHTLRELESNCSGTVHHFEVADEETCARRMTLLVMLFRRFLFGRLLEFRLGITNEAIIESWFIWLDTVSIGVSWSLVRQVFAELSVSIFVNLVNNLFALSAEETRRGGKHENSFDNFGHFVASEKICTTPLVGLLQHRLPEFDVIVIEQIEWIKQEDTSYSKRLLIWIGFLKIQESLYLPRSMLEVVLLDLRIGVGLLEPALHLLYVCCYRQTILGHVSLDMRCPVQWENAHLLVDLFKEGFEISRFN